MDYVGSNIDNIQNIGTDRNNIVMDVDTSSWSQRRRCGTRWLIEKS